MRLLKTVVSTAKKQCGSSGGVNMGEKAEDSIRKEEELRRRREITRPKRDTHKWEPISGQQNEGTICG